MDLITLFFDDYAVKIDKDSIKPYRYPDFDIDEVIPASYIISRKFLSKDFKELLTKPSEVESFVDKVCLKDKTDKDEYDDKKLTMLTTIGYLISTYKSRGSAKAVILGDSIVEDTEISFSMGGNGKGTTLLICGYARPLITVNGKTFDRKDKFPYQSVKYDTSVIALDDVTSRFSFDHIFSDITDGLNINKKFKDNVYIPFEASPKFVITTNFPLKQSGGSFKRRMHMVDYSNYFNANHTIHDEFGHDFFCESWDEDEWSRYHLFLCKCCSKYVEFGLHQSKETTSSAAFKNLVAYTGNEFYQWAKSNISEDEFISLDELFEKLIVDIPSLEKYVTIQKFGSWLSVYSDYRGYRITKKRQRTNQKNYPVMHYCFEDPSKVKIVQEDDLFQEVSSGTD